jgi:hypothetical protein
VSLSTTTNPNDTMTVSETIADEAGTGDEAYTANMLRNGVTKKSYLIEEEFVDVTQFHYFTGMRMATMELTARAGAIAQVTFGTSGKGGYSAQATRAASTAAVGSTRVLNCSENIGTILEGGSALATAIRACTLRIDNSVRPLPGLGSKYAVGINLGRQRVGGNFELYFEDETLLDKYIDHTETALVLPFVDSASNDIIFSLPSMYLTEGGSPAVPGGDDEVMQSPGFACRRDQTTALYQVQVDLLAA